MKKVTIITALLLIAICANAQTYSGQFKKQTTEHFKEGVLTTSSVKFTAGMIEVSPQAIKVNGEAYTVLKTVSTDKADEGYTTKSLIVVTQSKTGSYKVMDCVLLLKPNNAIAEVVFKKTKSTNVSYTID